MFNLTSSTPKTWQTVSRQADRANAEQSAHTYAANSAHAVRDLGGILRERREAMGASLAEVETATRIRQKYLSALEADDWHLLPGEIVGRGFLRNYATYLGLDATELVERRRAVADPSAASSLAGTSAASPLPPERNVDYRPKDVALKDEPEGIQQREIRTGPIFRTAGVLGALLLIWWLITSFGPQLAGSLAATVASFQEGLANANAAATATPDAPAIAIAPNAPVATTTTATIDSIADSARPTDAAAIPGVAADNAPPSVIEPTPTSIPTEAARTLILIPTNTPLPVAAAGASDANPAAVAPVATVEALAPTATPTTAPPTATPTEAVPTPEAPTATPAPPAVIAPACPDPRAVITSPGINQVLAGNVPVTGSATHEAFQYYKLEYAFGANATDGFVYFDGANSAVEGGRLGTFNSASLPNGDYTLRITVVDLSANYPPPCSVSITIAN